MRSGLACWFLLIGLTVTVGCWSDSSQQEVVVYAAQDAEFSQPMFDDFASESGIRVLPKFDTESTKTVGLAQAILAERERPRCDVFWNNEILNTLRLEQAGVLEVYRSKQAESFPKRHRSQSGKWQAFAARARVLLVNTRLVKKAESPRSIHGLADPKWRGKVGLAKPLFGTTATHAACLFAYWGEREARDFFLGLKANQIRILAGNKQVALSVASGQIAFGLTDTDDALAEVEKGSPVIIVYPDSDPDQMGTLFIPNTLCIVKGCKHPQAARQLVDYLLSPESEARLADGPSGQIPLNPAVKVNDRVRTPRDIKSLNVDFAQAVKAWDTTARFLRDEFARAE